MPTRVFIPLSSKKTPQGSNDNSRGGSRNVTPRSIYEAETPRTVAAALLKKQGLNRQQDHSSSAKAQKEYEENTLKVEPVFSSRIATTKPSATRRAATDPRLAPLESLELADHPENAARGARAAHKMARERETVKRAETRKHDLKKPLAVQVAPPKSEDSREKEAAKPGHPVAQQAERHQVKDYSATRAQFQASLKDTREKLFFVEPPKEKRLFHWENHVAEMEVMKPVAVDTYATLNRASGWKISKQKQEEKMHADQNKPLQTSSSLETENFKNMPSSIFQENDSVYPDHINIKPHSLGDVRNLYQETIPSVFDPTPMGGGGGS